MIILKKMNYTDIRIIKKKLKKILNNKRYIHSEGVANMAKILAKIYNEDEDKAYFTGLCHDIAKCLTIEESNRRIREYALPVKYINNIALAHSKVGAMIMKNEYLIKDDNIINAIAYHTTGRSNMSILEKIIFVADAIEENRNYNGLAELREKAKIDLDKAALEILEFSINKLKNENKFLDEDTIEARDFLKRKLLKG